MTCQIETFPLEDFESDKSVESQRRLWMTGPVTMMISLRFSAHKVRLESHLHVHARENI